MKFLHKKLAKERKYRYNNKADMVVERWPSWSKAHDWKSCIRATVSRVRIPFSPPENAVSVFGQILYDYVLVAQLDRAHGYEP